MQFIFIAKNKNRTIVFVKTLIEHCQKTQDNFQVDQLLFSSPHAFNLTPLGKFTPE